jgi:hypothetical protein
VYRVNTDYRQKQGIFSRRYWTETDSEDVRIDNCVYSPNTDIIAYASGVRASLFWTIFGPSAEDEETLGLVGSSGRLRLTRDAGEIDAELLHAIRRHHFGEAPVAGTTDGYESLRMVEATQRAVAARGMLSRQNEEEA